MLKFPTTLAKLYSQNVVQVLDAVQSVAEEVKIPLWPFDI